MGDTHLYVAVVVPVDQDTPLIAGAVASSLPPGPPSRFSGDVGVTFGGHMGHSWDFSQEDSRNSGGS